MKNGVTAWYIATCKCLLNSRKDKKIPAYTLIVDKKDYNPVYLTTV